MDPGAIVTEEPTIAKKLASRVKSLLQINRKTILLVEDEVELQYLYSQFLTSRGYLVTVAGTLEEAQKCLKNATFDLVLLDIVLPDGNGVYAIPAMKLQHPDLPIIILTALGYDEDLLQIALRDGASSYISKVLPLDQLLMEIHRVLKHGE